MGLADNLQYSLLRKSGMAGRPTTPRYDNPTQSYRHPTILRRRESPVELEEAYWLAENCNAIALAIDTLTKYIFRNGLEFEPKYSRACKRCKTEFEADMEPDHCRECGAGREAEPLNTAEGTWYHEPSQDELQQIRDWLRSVDKNGNTFLDALKMMEYHLNVADDAFMVLRQDYDLDAEGNIVDWTVDELFVADSKNMRVTGDPAVMEPGGEFWICLAEGCRPGTQEHGDTYGGNVRGYGMQRGAAAAGKVYKQPGRCNCGKKLHEVWYVSTESTESDEPTQYFLKREVIHTSKYRPTYDYGFSPIMSIYDDAWLLINQLHYMRTFYEEERTPRIMVSVPTNNPDSVQRLKHKIEDRNVSQGGHHVPFITYNKSSGEGGQLQVHELSKLPSELDYESSRDEAYRRIGARYGINAAIQGSTETGGLENKGPAQWTVTDRATEDGQSVYNEKVFPQLASLLRIECQKCDGEGHINHVRECVACGGDGKCGLESWDLTLAEAKEQDTLEETQVQLARVNEAMQMQQLGFEIKRREPDGTFVFSEEPTEQPPGGMGGMMGGGTGGGFDARPRGSFGSFGNQGARDPSDGDGV